ncbi:MAG: hypothetical protein Crog4KO_25850 [Crocinitomicaceae bacterium]
MLEVSISQVVFVTLESTLFLTQLAFLFTKLKSKFIKSFLVINAAMIIFNVVSITGNNGSGEYDWISRSLQIISIVLLLGSVWFYLHQVKSGIRKKHFWFISGIALVLVPVMLLLVSEFSAFNTKFLLSAVITFITLAGSYLFISFYTDKKVFLTFATVFIGFYTFSFVIHFSNSFEAMVIALNVLFLLLGLFHNLTLFNRIKVIFTASASSGKKVLKAELARYDLTPRQEEIAILVIEGYRSKEIAEMCFISPGAERKHVSNIMAAVGVSSRSELIQKFSNIH